MLLELELRLAEDYGGVWDPLLWLELWGWWCRVWSRGAIDQSNVKYWLFLDFLTNFREEEEYYDDEEEEMEDEDDMDDEGIYGDEYVG